MYKTDHELIVLSDTEVSGLVPQAVSAMDLPSSDGLNTYIVSHTVAHGGIKVAMSGLGGDELFGGYRSFNLLSFVEHWSPLFRLIPRTIQWWVAERGGAVGRMAEMMNDTAALHDRYESLRSFWSEAELQAMGVDHNVGYSTDPVDSRLPLRTQLSTLELAGYMRSTLLRDGDAMSMAHSLEMRVPFLDHKLVNHCLRVRAAGTGLSRTPKALLLDAAGDLLPPGIAERRKQGFVLPMDRWMRGPLHSFVTQGMEQLAQTAVLPHLDLKQLKRNFDAGHLQWARLWQFVVLGHWLHLNSMDRAQ
jgi:asparagine synthase (glutamine-hydrolysing)